MLFFWNENMNDLKNKLGEQFEAPSFEDWKIDAQKYLKNSNIDDLISKKLTSKVDIKSIYVDRPIKSIELNFEISSSSSIYSISSDYHLESDLELAHLLYLVDKSEGQKLTVRARIDSNFFLSIAKFRALRYLLNNTSLGKFNIEAYSTNINKSIIDENNNIIRLTTEAMSAKIGGCDSVDLMPYNSLDATLDSESSKFGGRVTENILNLLNDESYFDKVIDPLAGSYLLEELTLKIANSAAEYKALLNDLATKNELEEFLEQKNNEHFNHQKENLDRGIKKLIGVNIYQNSDEINGDSTDNDRLASDFEHLKQKVDNNKPSVYIANFQEKNSLQLPVTMALNTFNIEFESNSLFELVEDGFNTIKLYDPDLVILNGDQGVMRNLKNMLSEYSIISINDFNEDSMLSNIELILSKMSKVNNG